MVIPIGKKKATDSKLETTIQSEFPNYELRITNYLSKVAHTSRVVAAGI
ncbi:hypothetical protein [Nostoc sp.]